MKNTITRVFSALAALILAFGALPAIAFADGSAGAADASQEVGRVSGSWSLDLWHYSGGYWKVGNKDSEKIRVTDREIGALDAYLQANSEAVFTLTVPESIASLVAGGERGTTWDVVFDDYRGRPCAQLFAESAPKSVERKSGTQLVFTATPVFHFNKDSATLRDYVSGMAVSVPLVDRKYGNNIYSVFGNGRSAVQGLGYYNEDDPSDRGRNAIHPSMILNNAGALEAGRRITLGSSVVDSDGYTIGSGTFAGAGACGLHFEFPVSLVFYDLSLPVPQPLPDPGPDGPDDPEGPEDLEDPESGPGGQSVSEVEAHLDLPARSYVGHPVSARDNSLYTVDDQLYNAARAAELSIGAGSFSILERGAGSIRKSGRVNALAVFSRPGDFHVKLTATGVGGLTATDVKPIHIDKTPTVLADLGGSQKENRKQKLLITAAQDPQHPINSLTIVLKEAGSGETIRVSKAFGGAENAPVNTAHIKYRKLMDTGSDEYFLCAELDFLTKWHEEKELSYEVSVRDAAGGSDMAFGTFTVVPDEPPTARIGLEDVYYRGENSAFAAIEPSDLSEADGDALQRTWSVKVDGGSFAPVSSFSGYQDLSFGSGKDIRFLKKNVGGFTVRLFVKDRWTEETLEEYISESDYLTAQTEKSSRVDNVAPRVGLDMLRTESAQILLLAEDETAEAEAKALSPSLKAALLSEGIAADVHTELARSEAGEQTGKVSEILTGGRSGKNFRPEDASRLQSDFYAGMWQGGNVFSDGRCVYTLTGTVQTWAPEPAYSVNTYPYTLTCRSRDGAVLWETSLTQSMLPSSTYLRDASWGAEADGAWICLTEGDKTALFDAQAGTYIATLSCALGSFNLQTEEQIYAFRADGIYRVSRSGGGQTRVWSGSVEQSRLLGGQVQFVTRLDLGSGLGLYRASFDPSGEKVSCTLLQGSLSGYARDAEILALDAYGCAFVREGLQVYCFDEAGALIRRIDLNGYGETAAVFPVWRGDGRVTYIGQTRRRRASGLRETFAGVYGVYTDEAFEDSRSASDDYLNTGEPVVYALQDETGAIGIYLGAEYAYDSWERVRDHLLFTFKGSFADRFGISMEQGAQDMRFAAATATRNGARDIKNILVSGESPADEEARLKAQALSGRADYTCFARIGSQVTAAQLADAVKALKSAGENALVQRNAAGILQRTISLAPGATYFYEYDTTAEGDILSVSALMDGSGGSGYTVERSYAENFDDSAVEGFFAVSTSAIEGGRCRLSSLSTRENARAFLQEGTSTGIRFTVPAGSLAILLTDYAFRSASSDYLSKAFTLQKDGGTQELLEIPTYGAESGEGSYMHPSLLTAGAYTLSARTALYTDKAGRESACWVDNLQVLLVKSGTLTGSGTQALRTDSSVSGNGTMRHVSGSFTTPAAFSHFGPSGAQRFNGFSGAASLSESGSGNRTLTASLTVPDGKECVYAVFEGRGKGGSYETSSGQMRYYDTLWTLDGLTAGLHTAETGSDRALRQLPASFRLALRGFTGTRVLKASCNASREGEASLDELCYYLAPAGSSPALHAGRFFLSGGQLYAEDRTFSGSGRISLSLAEGEAVRSLRIYSLQGAVRSESLDVSFRLEGDLDGWTVSGGQACIEPVRSESELPARVYAKGEAIAYKVFYGDWEGDPSKKQHWVYTHEPAGDGLHPQAGKDLSAPIERFYIGGKYTVTHWQEDSTGNSAFDKSSNRVSITFYIQGPGGGNAPWVRYIRTDPGDILPGEPFRVQTGVDDRDKDPLDVTVELYKDAESEPIGTKTVRGLRPGIDGTYPQIVLDDLPIASPGTYDAVVRVTDGTGTGMDSYRFAVKENRSLIGTVSHTSAWEANRLAWNKVKQGTDAERPPHMFWPGETLVLKASAGGNPARVEAQLLEFPQYKTVLTKGADGADGKTAFSGQLWDASMLQTIGTSRPVPAVLRFTAFYADGSTLTCDVNIIFDQSRGSFYQLHRNY